MVSTNDLRFLADEYLKEQTLLFLKKNKDYGDSFTRSIQKFGSVSAFVRMEDKINRYFQLKDSTTIEVADEKIEDTLLDLLNYVVMYESYKRTKLVVLMDYTECLFREVSNLYFNKKSESHLYKLLISTLNFEEDSADQIFEALRKVIVTKIK